MKPWLITAAGFSREVPSFLAKSHKISVVSPQRKATEQSDLSLPASPDVSSLLGERHFQILEIFLLWPRFSECRQCVLYVQYMLSHSHTLSSLYFLCSSSWHVVMMCSMHLLKRHYFPFLWRKLLLQFYVFSIPKYKTTSNFQHFLEFQIWKFCCTTPTKVLSPPLVNQTVQSPHT